MLKKVIIGDLGEIYTGNTPSKKNNEYYESNDIMFIKPDIMSFDIENIAESNEYISEKARDKARIVPANSLLVSCIGNIGKLAINKEEASFNQQINAIVHNENIVSSKYLAYLLKYNQKRLEAIANAPVVPIINKTQFSNFEVSIHESLETQKKIVEVLGKAQELIDKRKEQIEALDELVKSRFIEMFGDPATNPKDWEVCEIGKYLNILTDYHSNGSYETLRDNVTLLDTPSYALMVRTTDLENNNFEDGVKYIDEHAYNHLEKSKVFGGEIIINKIGSAGKVYLMPFLNRPVSLAMNQFLLRFYENKVNHIFLYNLLLTPYMAIKINEKVRGAVTKTITKDAIREINIIVPPIELQNQFADFINEVDKLKYQMETSLKELENNFNSLMQKAFKGELF